MTNRASRPEGPQAVAATCMAMTKAPPKPAPRPALMKGLCEWLGVEMMNTQEIVQPSKVDGIHMMPEEHRKLALAVKEKLLAMMAK